MSGDGGPRMEGWTLEQVVGQLFVASVGHHVDGAYGFEDTVDTVGDVVARRHLGGVCYFPVGADGSQPAVIAGRVAALQARAEVPLLVSIDQEGGLVTRMREPATRWPSAMAQSAAFGGDPTMAGVERVARMSAAELRAAGVNHVFAPVADVNVEPNNPVIGIRSASSAPQVVARFVEATLRGHSSSGVASCLKHFPGHGDTKVDSHFGLPVLDIDLGRYRAVESVPFAAGTAAGAEAVMIGHLCAPGLDPSGAPATFSRPIVTGLLREELGFDGVIITDAMDMAGAAMGGDGGSGAACVAALKAGVDQVLMPRDIEGCIDAVIAAVTAGELDEAELRASAARIVDLKERIGLFSGADAAPAEASAHARAAQAAVSRALTWRDREVTLALDPARPVVVVHDPEPPSVGRGIEDVPTVLAEGLRSHRFTVEQVPLGDPVPDDATCILITRDAWRFPEVSAAVSSLVANGGIDVAVCARSPYDSDLLPESLPVLLSFGDIPGVGAALVDSLIAGVGLGSLPIDLRGVNDPSSVRWPRQVGPESAPEARIRIRPYRPEDRDALATICVRTGASGGDATGAFFSDDLLSWIYALPYVEADPELCLVAEVDGRVVGYILGTADVAAFAEWWQENWRERFSDHFPDDDSWNDRERNLVRKALEPRTMVAPWHDEHRAELHIDMLPVVQGMGLGRDLMDRFRALLAGRGVDSVSLGVGGTNTNAVAFYRRLGFRVLNESRNDAGEVTGYAMWIPTKDDNR